MHFSTQHCLRISATKLCSISVSMHQAEPRRRPQINETCKRHISYKTPTPLIPGGQRYTRAFYCCTSHVDRMSRRRQPRDPAHPLHYTSAKFWLLLFVCFCLCFFV